MNEDELSSWEQFVETDAPRKPGTRDRNRDDARRDSGPRGGERVASTAERTGSELAGIVKRSRRAQGLPDHVADSDALRRIAQILQIGSVSREASQREDDAGSTSIDSMTNETISRRSA
jgi:hypothetical protein